MRLLQILAFTLLTLPCGLAAPQNTQSSSDAVLPTVTAYALDKNKITLPGDFSAPLNLLILSFQRDQQSVVDGWVRALPQAGPVQTWVLPISPRANGLYRWWLNASLRGSLSPSQPRRYTVPLYVNKTQFLGALQVHSEQEVALLLTDKTGHVMWRAAGAVTDDKRAALDGFVKKSAARQ
jgi:hypothetical protein